MNWLDILLTAVLIVSTIAGFTTGAAVHVFTSQINSALNVKLPRYGGVGALYYIYRDLIAAVVNGEVCKRVRAHTSTAHTVELCNNRHDTLHGGVPRRRQGVGESVRQTTHQNGRAI